MRNARTPESVLLSSVSLAHSFPWFEIRRRPLSRLMWEGQSKKLIKSLSQQTNFEEQSDFRKVEGDVEGIKFLYGFSF